MNMMKVLYSTSLFLLSLWACGTASKSESNSLEFADYSSDYQGYTTDYSGGKNFKIEVKVKGIPAGTEAMLSFGLGEKDKYFSLMSAKVDDKGWITFSDTAIERGFYMVYFPERRELFEIVVADQKFFKIETDTAEGFYKNMKITGCVQNQQFLDYNRFLMKKGEENRILFDEIQQLEGKKGPEAKINELKDKKAQNDQLVKDLRLKIINETPEYLLASFLNMMRDIDVPDAPAHIKEDDKRNWQYQYYKANYWNNVNFKEPGLIRGQGGIFHSLVERFLDKTLPQDPDTLIKYVDQMIQMATIHKNDIVEKYLIQHLTRKYETSKIMCHDGIFSFLARKYYCPDQNGKTKATWITDTEVLEKICQKGLKLAYTSCKSKALDLKIADVKGNYQYLYKENKSFTVILFWDPTCGHCKKVVPKVNDLFNRYKDVVSVYAISTEAQYEQWKKYMEEHPEIHHWTNVCKTEPSEQWKYNRAMYNVESNPIIFLLDKDKKIIAKKMDENKLEEFIVYQMGEYGMMPSDEVQKKLKELQAKSEEKIENHDGDDSDKS
jgi:thiol-disulfide isomerase/thioredoxin